MAIKVIEIGENLLKENDKIAEQNRKLLAEKKIKSFNVMGSPGSGKTTILLRTIEELKNKYSCGIIEGDIAGTFDSKKFERFNIPVTQINTGGACHLDAYMVKKGLNSLPLEEIDLLFIENVGNLVCPAEFKLGLGRNIVISSITEGEDKPAKYPLMFSISKICLLNKIDIAVHLDFNIATFKKYLLRVSPEIKLINLSARTGENLQEWIDQVDKQK
jgi:hydrogenase nickel incorporation protein HypB